MTISPNPLSLYVSEPNKKLTAKPTPDGGTFTWTSSDPSKLAIAGTGNSVVVQGLDEGNVQVTVSYSVSGCGPCSDTVNVTVQYEVRHILVAQGIQFNNKDEAPDDRIPTGYLADKLGADLTVSGTSATYKSVPQGVKYLIDVTTDKAEFKSKLETANWHVIYDGHSRYGRGACFGTDDSPGEDWESGTDPAHTGLYRMGFPFVGVTVSDIIHHGYTASVVPASVRLRPSDCEQDLRNNLGAVRGFRLTDVDSAVRGQLTIGGAPVGPADRFWGYHWPGEGKSVVLFAGWTGTASDPMDLGATNLQCRVFCHFGCSSKQHYYDIVRNRKKWKKVGDSDHFAYFTTYVAYSVTGSFWLRRLLTYDQFNAGKPWEPSLDYAKAQSKNDLSNWCTTNGYTAYEIW